MLVAQVARGLGLHGSVLRKWVKARQSDPQHAFRGHGRMNPAVAERDRLRKEGQKLRAERGVLKNAAANFARESL